MALLPTTATTVWQATTRRRICRPEQKFRKSLYSSRDTDMANLPPIVWAQRKDAVFVTIEVPDVTEQKIDLDENFLHFS
jgi:hypothetical protein